MKAIKMRIQKSSRWLVILLATVVVILTSMVVANATQTITTPNAAFISYNLAPGANSAVITPATNKSVSVMGCCTGPDPGIVGVGQVTLVHIPGVLIQWVGLESFYGAAITASASNTAGAHIVYIDFSHQVQIETASADTIRIHNGSGAPRAGNVTLVW